MEVGHQLLTHIIKEWLESTSSPKLAHLLFITQLGFIPWYESYFSAWNASFQIKAAP